MTRREWAADKLGIPLSASIEEAKLARRDLMQIWHPDLHQANGRLHARAEGECKAINLAFDVFAGRDSDTPIPGTREDPPPSKGTSRPTAEPATPRTSEYTYPPHGATWSASHQPTSRTSSGGGSGSFGGLIIGGFIGLFFGGWGAIPGAIIGALLGSALGDSDGGAGRTLDEGGGCLLGGLVQLISAVFSSVAGCGCLIAVLFLVAIFISAVAK